MLDRGVTLDIISNLAQVSYSIEES